MDLRSTSGAVETAPPTVMIDRITTLLDDTTVLDELTFEVPAGRVTVLMGPSGVGKSTLVKHVLGLLEPDAGTVLVDGEDIWEFSSEEWRRLRARTGAMLGGSYLVSASTFGSLTVLENLTFTLEALGVPLAERHDRVMARLEELKLVEYHDRTPAELPAHATKRLALARALVVDAPLIVLDEIDVGLDRQHSAATVDAIRGLRARTECTILLTTHSIDLARTIGDQLAVMVDGKIVAQGQPDELLRDIQSSDDFDRVFQFSRHSGPAESDADARPVRGRRIRGSDSDAVPQPVRDPQMVWIAVVAVLVIVAVVVVMKLHLM
jgi:phospholipid/cholesterol/gamma-HCH transport system ATP-binding protein